MIFKVNICLLILASLFLHNTEGMPSFHRRQVPIDGPSSGVRNIPGEQETCEPFQHHYCTAFGYNTTKFPNIRGHQTASEAAAEFQNFEGLLSSNCSTKIGTLLCFLYFPYCDDYSNLIIQPCEETCIEAQSDECTTLVENSKAKGWAEHLQCNYTIKGDRVYKKFNETKICANGTQPVWVEQTLVPPVCSDEDCDDNNDSDTNDGDTDTDDGDTDTNDGDTDTNSGDGNGTNECTENTHNCINTEACVNTPTSYECRCPNNHAGDGRADGTGCTDCKKCKIRSRATANTFKNRCYTFAAKVNLLSVSKCGDQHCAEFTVLEQFGLKTWDTVSNTLVLAPDITENINVTIDDVCYHCLDLEINQVYLIGGFYECETDGLYSWEIQPNGLVSNWTATYDKKLDTWITKTNNALLNSPDCTITLNCV